MEYAYSLTVPAGTTKKTPVSTTCLLSKGIIHHYSIVFPEGCNNLVSIVALHNGFQCFPLNSDGAIKGNANPVEKTTFFPLETPPYELKVKGWSPDCTYDHTILLQFDVLPREYFDQSKNTEEIIKAVTGELQSEYLQSSKDILESVQSIAHFVTPQRPSIDLEPAEETNEEIPPAASPLDALTFTDLAVIKAQIRRGWNDNRITQDAITRSGIAIALLEAVLPLLREAVRIENG